MSLHYAADEVGLARDVQLLMGLLDDAVREYHGDSALELTHRIRQAALALREGTLPGGRDAFAQTIASLSVAQMDQLARAFAQLFHLINSAEEQHRIRTLQQRDLPDSPVAGSIAASCLELAKAGARPDEVRALLQRLFVMPVLTAHPTEARRSTVLDHLEAIAGALNHLNDPRAGYREQLSVKERLHEAVLALCGTAEVRPSRPRPLDEVRAGLHVFDRTLLDVTPRVHRELEEGLAAAFPGEAFSVPAFLQWGSWIGGDRDGNPNVTAEVTHAALERHRALVLSRYARDVEALGRELSIAGSELPPTPEFEKSLEVDRERLPELAARVRRYAQFEPWREKLWYMRRRLDAARSREEGAYPDVETYLGDLRILISALESHGLQRLAGGQLRDAWRRAQVFGFHLASLDLRQHSDVHQAAVAELLALGGVSDYARKPEADRVKLLAELIGRVELVQVRDVAGLSESTRELLKTLQVVGRARRDSGPRACERYVISFSRSVSDVLEVLFLSRAAGLAHGEIRPVPLLEQLEDLERAEEIASGMIAIDPVRAALGRELEVMVGYSDSSKQAGYVASARAVFEAQESLARAADSAGLTLTIFHGRGGAVGRGGGPTSRAIRAQPPEALRGRLRVTEQGETIAARYGRPEIARRDLEQMVGAVLAASVGKPTSSETPARKKAMARAASAALGAYRQLVGDERRLAEYVVQATPIEEISQMHIASRPASRKPGLRLDDLRAIPWVFSWNQSRHGVPGWFGLGSALDEVIGGEGIEFTRQLYREWPLFRALIDNAQLALVRADLEVAERYASIVEGDARKVFSLIRAEHQKAVARILEVTGQSELLAEWPTIARTVRRRNPYVDVLSHLQIELLKRVRANLPERELAHQALFVTIHGIAAGLQTAG